MIIRHKFDLHIQRIFRLTPLGIGRFKASKLRKHRFAVKFELKEQITHSADQEGTPMQNKALVIIDIQNDITKNYKEIIDNM